MRILLGFCQFDDLELVRILVLPIDVLAAVFSGKKYLIAFDVGYLKTVEFIDVYSAVAEIKVFFELFGLEIDL